MMTTATHSPVTTGTWSIDPVHSVAGFRVKHFGITWLRGKFDEFALDLTVTEDGAARLEGSTPVQSIAFPNEQLHGHLMSPEFFDAELHPRLTFSSDEVVLAEDGTATVRGELTMRGTTRPVELTGRWSGPVQGMAGEERIGLEIAGEVDRFDFGIAWDAKLTGGHDVVGRTVRLEGEFELVRQ